MRLFAGSLLILAAFATSAAADVEAAIVAFDNGEYETAFKQAMPDAEAGDPRAEWLVAVMCRDKLSVKRDSAAVLAWMRRAAEHGLPAE